MPEHNKAALADLLTNYISTLEELDVVLALAAETGHMDSAGDVGRAAGLPEAAAHVALERLLDLGLVSHQLRRGYVINRRRPAVVAGVAALVRACETNRVAIIAQLSSNALTRVRRAAARSFRR